MIYHFDIFNNIGFTIIQALRTLVAKIATTLYNYIIYLYHVFEVIARVDIMDDKYVQLIYNRVGIILGLFMLFKLSFSLIQSLINPDKFTDKKNGFSQIIFRSVIAIVLLGVTPSIFKYAREFQNLVVGAKVNSNNVIYRIIVADDTIQNTSTSFGRRLARDLFFSFFREKEEGSFSQGYYQIEDFDGHVIIRPKDYGSLYEDYLNEDKDFGELVDYMSIWENGSYVFDWDIILSVGTAIAILWILINYCISVATRVIQLAYLQLVSPIPILSYIGDPDGSFKKWVNQCTSTYLDLFIRLAIIYFIVALSGKFLNTFTDKFFENNYGLPHNSFEIVLVRAFIIIGLLMFGKRVPELLKELFPGNGSFDFGVKGVKNLIKSIPGASFAVGTATGAALGSAGRVVGGLAHGAVNMKKAWQQNKGAGWKRGLKTLGFGAKGLGAAAIGGITGGVGGGYRNRKGGFASAVSGGWSSLRKPIQGDIDSWKKHKNERSEARQEEKAQDRLYIQGKALYDEYGKDGKLVGAFSSEYEETYTAKDAANTAVLNANSELQAAENELQTIIRARDTRIDEAISRGAPEKEINDIRANYEARINAAKEMRASKQKAFEGAQAAYKRADEAHTRSQQLHSADFAREQAFKKFKNTYGDLSVYDQEKRDREVARQDRKQERRQERQERRETAKQLRPQNPPTARGLSSEQTDDARNEGSTLLMNDEKLDDILKAYRGIGDEQLREILAASGYGKKDQDTIIKRRNDGNM